MRVHLVNAAVQYLLPRLEDFPCNVLPYGFCVVAATLKKHDINVDILDLNYYDGMAQIESVEEANLFLYNDVLSPSLERILVRITADIQNTVVGFSCLGFDALRRSLILAKYIKENNEKRINVFGGAAIHSNAQELMNDFPFVDYIIIKNGEHAFCELIHCLAQKRGITHIPNLAFRMDNRIIINPLSPYDLDDQTCPDYSFYETLDTDFFALEYMTSQGCRNRCLFCGVSENPLMTKRVSKVIKDVRTLKARYRCNVFQYQDDNFISDRDRTIHMLDEFKKLDIIFYTSISPNLIDEDLVARLASAGCVEIVFGLQSASKSLLRCMNKSIDLGHFEGIVNSCQKSGIRLIIDILAGYPGETRESIHTTIEYVRRLQGKIARINLNRFIMDMNSPLSKTSDTNPIDSKDVRKFSPARPVANKHIYDLYKTLLDEHSVPYI